MPAFSGRAKAAMIARAPSISAAVGAKAALQMSIWLGSISVLPSRPYVPGLFALGLEADGVARSKSLGCG